MFCLTGQHAQPAADATFHAMGKSFSPGVYANCPHGTILGAFAAVSAFYSVELGQKMRRREKCRCIKLVDRPHGQTATLAA